MLLQVGKTYLTRDGLSVEIIGQHEVSGPFAMLGKMVENGALMYFDPSGRHAEEETQADLVLEACVEPAPIAVKPRSMLAMLDQITQSNKVST